MLCMCNFLVRCAQRWSCGDLDGASQDAKYVQFPELWKHDYLQNAMSAEPGGFLQWADYEPTAFKVVPPNKTPKQSANEHNVADYSRP